MKTILGILEPVKMEDVRSVLPYHQITGAMLDFVLEDTLREQAYVENIVNIPACTSEELLERETYAVHAMHTRGVFNWPIWNGDH